MLETVALKPPDGVKKRAIADGKICMLTELLEPYLDDAHFEWFVAAGFDQRMHLLEFGHAKGKRASNNFVIACTRKVLGHNGVTALVIAHNHPDGPLRPSPQDIDATRRVAALCRLAGARLIDHLIHAPEGWLSLREAGHIH